MTFFELVLTVWTTIAALVALIVVAIVWAYRRMSRRLSAIERRLGDRP